MCTQCVKKHDMNMYINLRVSQQLYTVYTHQKKLNGILFSNVEKTILIVKWHSQLPNA